MSSDTEKPAAATRRLLSAKSLLLMLLVCLLAFTATALAQEDEPVVPGTEDFVVLSEEVLPYGVQTYARVYTNNDAVISSGQPSANFGGSTATTMAIGYNSPTWQAVRALMKFDLSPIPSTAQVNSATLNIFQSLTIPSNDGNMGFKAQFMTKDWSETAVTWNNANYLGGATIGIGDNTSALGWKQSNITDLIRSWHSGSEPNYGMLVTGDESSANNRSRWFYTKEYLNGLYRPYVDVDYTTCSDTTKPFSSVNPLPQWSQAGIHVTWSGTDSGGSGIAYYNIQVSVNQGTWQNWLQHTTATAATYTGSNGQRYDFRAQAVDNCGNIQDWPSSQAWTIVDTEPPQATVNPLPEYTLVSSFPVSWSGQDNPGGSGIANYDIQVQVEFGAWTSWLNDVTYTNHNYNGAQNLMFYGFRARATDRAGNVQSWSSDAQAETLVVLQPYASMESISPPYTQNDQITLHWDGVTAPGTSITRYDVRYRFKSGSWLALPGSPFAGNEKSAVFTFPNPEDGTYDFEARATNSAGQVEPWTGVRETLVYVDRNPPFVTPSDYLPFMTMDQAP